jgi:HEPN domain-containing protein
VNSRRDVEYRLKLASGFLEEAQQDLGLKRWRSCVSNAQLSVENAGKAILMIFGVSPKTHDPARHLAALVTRGEIPASLLTKIKEILPDLITLGFDQHVLTDYGDESSYALPWDIFDEESANMALRTANEARWLAEQIVSDVSKWREEQ